MCAILRQSQGLPSPMAQGAAAFRAAPRGELASKSPPRLRFPAGDSLSEEEVPRARDTNSTSVQ